MTKTKFKAGDRIIYVGGMQPLQGKVLMANGAIPVSDYGVPSYDIQIEGQHEVYTVGEKSLRPLMSDAKIAEEIYRNYVAARTALLEARAALKRARYKLVEDGQPDYEVTMLDEFEIVLKNTLRFELTNESTRWDDITVERKKLK